MWFLEKIQKTIFFRYLQAILNLKTILRKRYLTEIMVKYLQ